MIGRNRTKDVIDRSEYFSGLNQIGQGLQDDAIKAADDPGKSCTAGRTGINALWGRENLDGRRGWPQGEESA